MDPWAADEFDSQISERPDTGLEASFLEPALKNTTRQLGRSTPSAGWSDFDVYLGAFFGGKPKSVRHIL
jgi:hypothetical protein